MAITRVTSADDGRLAPYLHLTNHQLRSSAEGGSSLMVVESLIAIEVALKAGAEPVSFFVEDRHLERLLEVLEGCGRADAAGEAAGEGPDILVAGKELMSQTCGFNVTRGYLSVMRRPEPRRVSDVLGGARRVAILEDLVDASNVGAIFRSAAALCVDAVILSPHCLDPLCRRAIRTSMGTVFQVPWARAEEPWPDACASALRQADFSIAGMALKEDALPLDDPSLARHERLALAFGTEGQGLSPAMLGACDQAVIIPMSHGVDSLNVAASSAVAFWELCTRHQRYNA